MMKVIGWIATILGLIALGCCTCKFGWLDMLFRGFKEIYIKSYHYIECNY